MQELECLDEIEETGLRSLVHPLPCPLILSTTDIETVITTNQDLSKRLTHKDGKGEPRPLYKLLDIMGL